MKDRLKRKLKAKKILGNNKSNISSLIPQLPGKKEYEMPAEYQENLQTLTEMIEKRDEYARTLPALPPDVRAEALPHFRELDSAVENLEQKMADEYKRFQAEKRREDEISESIGKGMEAVEKLFIIIKHQRPHLFKEFKAVVTKDMTADEEQEFYDRIAILEATKLKEILAGE